MARRSVGKLLLAHFGIVCVVNFVKSCRQSLNFKSYEQRGAVIREKKVQRFYEINSLVDTRSVIFIRNARLRVSKETSKQDRYEKQVLRGF